MRIFISSTCYDLIDIRAEINYVLNKSGLKSIMSDQANSDFNIKTNTNSIETCLINLRNSDIVVIILSKRYGPKLGKAGFENISATHLEYKEAVKENKTILFYMRDRLEADYNLYRKTKDASKLSWVGEKDLGLFNMIEEHSKLTNTNNNNWYYAFTNSIDLKERLIIDLQDDITNIKLDTLIKSGKTPYLMIKHKLISYSSPKLILELSLNNIGLQPALDPVAAFTKANTYQEILDNSYYDNLLNYNITTFNFLKSNEAVEFQQEINIDNDENVYFFEIFYKTLTGQVISDITRCSVKKSEVRIGELNIKFSYEGKRYLSDESFQKIAGR